MFFSSIVPKIIVLAITVIVDFDGKSNEKNFDTTGATLLPKFPRQQQKACHSKKLGNDRLHGVRFTGPVIMRYTWYKPDRKCDKDNIAFARKFVQDSLVSTGPLKNDGWKEIKNFTDDFAVDKENPRVKVFFEER